MLMSKSKQPARVHYMANGFRLLSAGDTDRQRAAALERFIIGGPVPGLVAGGCGSAQAAQQPRWIHEMNPSRDLCNRAMRRPNR